MILIEHVVSLFKYQFYEKTWTGKAHPNDW